MSTRAVARLSSSGIPSLGEADQEGSESDGPAPARPAGFDLLSSSDSADSEEEAAPKAGLSSPPPSTQPKASPTGSAEEPTGDDATPASGQSGGRKARKKKKKRNKKKSKEAKADGPPSARSGEAAGPEAWKDPVAASSGAASRGYDVSAMDSNAASGLRAVLAVEPKDLNEEHELKRRFGAATINAARAEEQEDRREIARRSGRRGRGHSQSGAAARRLRARAMRRLMLSKPDPALPRPPTAAEGGLTMEPCDPPAADAEGRPVRSDPACAYFRYRHGSLYAAADAEFGAAAATYDPAALSAVMQRHPYHLRTLLQLAQLHTQFAEFDMASSLLSRAMVVLESAWHPAFAPHTGACRLPHAFPENRPVFDILRMHARMLARRGCSSAALAVTTLQLALDPEADPLGALLTVDYYGLRAGDATKVDSLLSWSGWPPLPNLRFSKALAAFHCGRADRARSLLVDALLLLPSALPPLVHESKLIDGGSAPAHASAEAQAAACIPWADILGLPLFANALEESARRLAADPGCAALLREGTAPGGDVEDTAQAVLDLEEKLVELFVARHRSLWGEPAPGLLLAEAAREAADASDTAVRGATMRRIRALLPGGSLQRYAAFTSEDVSDEIVTMRRQDIGLAPGPGGADGGGGGGIRLPGADAGLHAGVFGGQGHGAALRGDGEDPEAWLQEAMLAEEAAGGVPQGQAASMLDQLRGAIHNWMGGIIAPANGGDAQAGAADWDSDDGDEDEGYEVDTDGSDDMEQ